MSSPRSLYIILLLVLIQLNTSVYSQVCIKDSNYYTITYHGLDKNHITAAAAVAQNEVVTLARHSVFSDFITKYTSQGSVIWSNEYTPDYPYVNWFQFPWYNNTLMAGMATGNDSTSFVFGSSVEHGKSVNNVEDPPTHKIGFYLHLDKFGNIISGKYFGNWRTDYSVSSLLQLANGNVVVYLRSDFYPYISKLLCLDAAGQIRWGTALQVKSLFYREEPSFTPVLKQMKNGNIVVANGMVRSIADTLQYPFQPAIILPAPLHYFHLYEINGSDGAVRWENSYQCPPLTNTDAPFDFVPTIKNITELPNGNLSFLADMYVPNDNEIFYKHYRFLRSPVNFVTSDEGYFLRLITYQPVNGSAGLASAETLNINGDQVALARNTQTQDLIQFAIDANEHVLWTKSFNNLLNTGNSTGLAVKRKDNKGYFIFQSDPNSVDFKLNITNAIGNNPCVQTSTILGSQSIPWPWYVNKVKLIPQPLDVDFRISDFRFTRKPHPISQQADCQFEQACCTDIIDTLNTHQINICEDQSYTLPDNTIARDSGTYYITLKTTGGCDSLIFYRVNVLLSPDKLQTTPDTCLNGVPLIRLRASEGYDGYWWNNIATNRPEIEVHTPGTYTIRVQNACGSNTDTIVVYDQCDFPIFFPSAFTPNNDLLNDVLKVPHLNRNKLRRLSIYNRWGELVFSTSDLTAGWDGTVGGKPQPAAVYVYQLEMEDLSGKKLSQHGTVVLIR